MGKKRRNRSRRYTAREAQCADQHAPKKCVVHAYQPEAETQNQTVTQINGELREQIAREALHDIVDRPGSRG